LASKNELIRKIEIPNLNSLKDKRIVIGDSVEKFKPFLVRCLASEDP